MIRRIRNITAVSVFLTVLLLASSVFGANWFVDTTLSTGSNDGSSMDDAWQSIKTAFESTGFSAGDYLWIRRTSSFASASANITVTDDGTSSSWIHFVGCPRNSHAISSSDWTNGSTSVNVDDADMDREKHQGRYITAPDSRTYLITRVVDASTIVIDREYVGSTASNAAATISADEDYATFQAIDDSAWTIKKSDWNADADDLPKIDFESTAYGLLLQRGSYIDISNLEICGGGSSSVGTVTLTYSWTYARLTGCLVKASQNAPVVYNASASNYLELTRCIIEGTGSGSSQNGLRSQSPDVPSRLKDVAIYNCGNYGIYSGNTDAKNINVGVEQANGNYDISAASVLHGYDIKLGGTNGYVEKYNIFDGRMNAVPRVTIENYGKVLGEHQAVIDPYAIQKHAVVAGSGDPYKRTSGADAVVSMQPNLSSSIASIKTASIIVFDHVIYADTSSKSYRYYVQLKDIAGLTADQLYVECVYVSGYDDTSEYQTTTVYSDETPAVRTGADDWSQYIEVTGIQPAVASNVHLRVRLQGYDADGYLYIDPLPYIY